MNKKNEDIYAIRVVCLYIFFGFKENMSVRRAFELKEKAFLQDWDRIKDAHNQPLQVYLGKDCSKELVNELEFKFSRPGRVSTHHSCESFEREIHPEKRSFENIVSVLLDDQNRIKKIEFAP